MIPFDILLFLLMVLLVITVAPIWIIMHYRNPNRSNRGLSEEDRQHLEQTLVAIDKLDNRIVMLESILDADHPGWRQLGAAKE